MGLFRIEQLTSSHPDGHILVTDLDAHGDTVGADVADWTFSDRGRPFLRREGAVDFPTPFSSPWEAVHLNDNHDISGFFGADGSHEEGNLVRRAGVAIDSGQVGIDVHALLQAHEATNFSQCLAINNRGQALGYYTTQSEPVAERGFVFDVATRQFLFLVDRGLPTAKGISDSQRIIGPSRKAGSQGYRHDLQTAATVDLAFSPSVISSNGDWIVGSGETGTVLWRGSSDSNDPGEQIGLRGLDGLRGNVLDVNDFGLAVGLSRKQVAPGASDYAHAVLYVDGQPRDLNEMLVDTDLHLREAVHINNKGVIHAHAVRPEDLPGSNGPKARYFSVLLHPVPSIDFDVPYLSFEQLFGASGVDGGGIGVVGGKLRPIPPWDPEIWRLVWEGMQPAERDILGGLGLSRYARGLANPSAQKALLELSQKLISDSARALGATKQRPPRLKLGKDMHRLERNAAHADADAWASIASLLESMKRG